jgi:ATP-dependent exoDNAse (exonuclease V) beta subunit
MQYEPIAIDWQLEQTTREDGTRCYTTPSGAVYPSVTTVVGWEKSQQFAEWRRRNPQESARVLRRGTAFHSLMEDWIKTGTLQSTPETDLALQLQSHVHEHMGKVYGLEVPLWSVLLELAGRTDCVGEYKGKLSVVDFKASTRAKRADDIENYFMQATAYAIMWHERTGQPVEQIVILIASEDGITQEMIRRPQDFVPQLKRAIEIYKNRG